MPPKRRTRGATAAQAQSQQGTLSFGGKASRVTKPATAQQIQLAKKEGGSLAPSKPAAAIEVQLEDDKATITTANAAIEPQSDREAATLNSDADPLAPSEATSRVEDVLGGRAAQGLSGATGGSGSGWVGDEEVRARKLSDTQIKRYWRAKEQERKAPRVHQQDLSVYEKVLREWDMSGQYGPCIGIARLKRWKRANLLGLEPPIEVLAVLLKDMEAGETKSQRAYVDELMISRFIET